MERARLSSFHQMQNSNSSSSSSRRGRSKATHHNHNLHNNNNNRSRNRNRSRSKGKHHDRSRSSAGDSNAASAGAGEGAGRTAGLSHAVVLVCKRVLQLHRKKLKLLLNQLNTSCSPGDPRHAVLLIRTHECQDWKCCWGSEL